MRKPPPRSKPGRSHKTQGRALPGHLLSPADQQRVLARRDVLDKPWATAEEWLAQHEWPVTQGGRLLPRCVLPLPQPLTIREL